MNEAFGLTPTEIGQNVQTADRVVPRRGRQDGCRYSTDNLGMHRRTETRMSVPDAACFGYRPLPPMKALAPTLQQVERTSVLYRNRKLSYFGGCDYFRLSSHPAVLATLGAGLKRYGLSVAASRKTTGNHALYERLERCLADFFDAGDAVLVSNGYATNIALAQTLAGQFSHVLIDEEAHASLVDAAPCFRRPILRFPNRDSDAVARIVHRLGRASRPVLLTDGMFSHDGNLAPIPAYLRELPDPSAIVLDDAHGAGILGSSGRGTAEALGVRSKRIIQTISLSKAFGVYGGAVLGSRSLCDRIRNVSRLFGGSTPLPLPLVNAALQAVRLVKSDGSLRRRLERNVHHVRTRLRLAGLSIPDTQGPVIALTPRAVKDEERLRRRLMALGVYPCFIRYPGGYRGGYFRFAISSEHTRNQLDRLVRALVGAVRGR